MTSVFYLGLKFITLHLWMCVSRVSMSGDLILVLHLMRLRIRCFNGRSKEAAILSPLVEIGARNIFMSFVLWVPFSIKSMSDLARSSCSSSVLPWPGLCYQAASIVHLSLNLWGNMATLSNTISGYSQTYHLQMGEGSEL